MRLSEATNITLPPEFGLAGELVGIEDIHSKLLNSHINKYMNS